MSKEESIFDDVPLMDTEAQELYVNSLISSSNLFLMVNHVLDAKYFDEHLQKPVEFIKQYFQRHKAIPSREIIKTVTKFEPIPTDVISREDLDFMANQIANFCKFRAVIASVFSAPNLIKENQLGKLIKELTEATQISLNTELGIDYFSDVEARILLSAQKAQVISTGWETVDMDVEGIGRQELILLLAPSGGGKSVGMTNLGLNLCSAGMNGVYISLEMRDDLVARRFDSMISNIAGKFVALNVQKVVDDVELFEQHAGKLYIRRMREGSNANDFAAYINDLQRRTGVKVDFIIIDYLDIANPISKIDAGNMFLKDKYVAEEIRALGMDFDAIVISASQLGRDAWEKIRNNKPLGQDDIQGGMSKINTSDMCIAIIKDEAMEAAGQIQFQYLKTRNSGGVGKSRRLAWSPVSLRITDLDEQAMTTGVIESKIKIQEGAKKPLSQPMAPRMGVFNMDTMQPKE
jgi:replicative DNA helicase